jgi:gliding motility-associated-like protein
LLGFTEWPVWAQNIGGVVNTYYEITGVFATYVQAAAGEDLGALQAGDKVILMQMSGVVVTSPPDYDNLLNAGRYEMLSVKSVNNISKEIEFTVSLNLADYTSGEKFQLIKIFESDYATVTSQLTATPWNGAKGGVVALVIFKKLTLNANINVNGQGFRGADPEPDYSAGCNPSAKLYFLTGTPNVAGRKGEGPVQISWDSLVGPGSIVTGGGGGIGWYAGGGGGSHFGQGGAGGNQQQGCSPTTLSMGGLALNSTGFYSTNRVTMGGGGGSSTQSATDAATAGGNGGGIVIILTDTLVSNGSLIQCNGESVSGTAQAGGGGGGGGGSILLDVNVFVNPLNLSARGGNGGSTGTLLTGAGGGGGGGIILYAGSTLSPSITYSVVGGIGGVASDGNLGRRGNNGSAGGAVANLKFPLHGFLFNSLNGTDTLCEGQQPNLITASMPKGGKTDYIYTWLQSNDNSSWSPASGSGDSLNFQPGVLNETTYFTRVVESGDVSDTALSLEIFVYNAIDGNNLALRDTLCSGTSPGSLTGGNLTGGDGSYAYLWQSSSDLSTWTNRVSTPALNEGTLTQSTYYRRIVESANVCVDTSATDTLTILPLIGNNTILSPDTAVCELLDAGTILSTSPTGGDEIYRFQWQESEDDLSYTDIPGAINSVYSPGNLTSPTYYKRTVFSGSDDVCFDISDNPRFVNVYTPVTSNVISTDSSRYCEDDIPLIFTGLNAGGGDPGNYMYSWYRKMPGDNWQQIESETGISYQPSIGFTDTVLIRRVVTSGDFAACVDSGNILQIDVIPAINNTLISLPESICEGNVPLDFTELPASGGNGGFSYLWEFQEVGNTLWDDAPEDNSANDQPGYASPGLFSTTSFRRQVQSEICIDYSNVITITVFPLIGNNGILGTEIQYACFNAGKTLNGSLVTGGDPDGSTRNYIWQQTADAVIWTTAEGNNSGQNYTSNPLFDSAYFRRIVTSGPAEQCKDTSEAVLIRINPLPTGDIISGIDTLCAGDEINVSFTGLSGNGPWVISVGETGILHTEPNITNSDGDFSFVITQSAGVQMLVLADDSLCLADLTANTGLVEATVFEVPAANAGENIEICELEAILSAIPTVGTGSWSGEGIIFADPASASTGVTGSSYGLSTLTWTEINWECQTTDDVDITFYQTPQEAQAGEDQVLDYYYTASLTAIEPSIGSGIWTVPEGNGDIADPLLALTHVTFEEPGIYQVQWTVTNGVCEPVSDMITITIDELRQYTGFSPNNDGVNDLFTLRFPGNTHVELLIYDQWGGLIYSQSAENAESVTWDGTYKNGRIASEGTYFYIVKENGQIRKNYLELRR